MGPTCTVRALGTLALGKSGRAAQGHCPRIYTSLDAEKSTSDQHQERQQGSIGRTEDSDPDLDLLPSNQNLAWVPAPLDFSLIISETRG